MDNRKKHQRLTDAFLVRPIRVLRPVRADLARQERTLKGSDSTMQMRRRMVWLAAFLIVTALLIGICVTLYVKNQPTEFDGTLVNQSVISDYNL